VDSEGSSDLGLERPGARGIRKNLVTLAAAVAVTGAFVWLLRAGALPVLPPKGALASVPWWTIPAFVVVWLAVLLLRALRWKILLDSAARVPAGRVILVSLIGFAALVIFPFRAGEVVRPAMIRKKGEISGWTATGTVGAERIIDGLVLSFILIVGLRVTRPLSPMPDHIGDLPVPVAAVPVAAMSAGIMFAAAFAVIFLFYWKRAFAARVIERVGTWISPRVGSFAAASVDNFSKGLVFLAQPGRAIPFFGVTLLHWGLNALSIWIVAHGCGMQDLTLPEALVALGVQGIGSMLPNAPGFFGVFQISMYAAFALYFAPSVVVGPGAVAVFLLYTLNIGITLLAGAGALALYRREAG